MRYEHNKVVAARQWIPAFAGITIFRNHVGCNKRLDKKIVCGIVATTIKVHGMSVETTSQNIKITSEMIGDLVELASMVTGCGFYKNGKYINISSPRKGYDMHVYLTCAPCHYGERDKKNANRQSVRAKELFSKYGLSVVLLKNKCLPADIEVVIKCPETPNRFLYIFNKLVGYHFKNTKIMNFYAVLQDLQR